MNNGLLTPFVQLVGGAGIDVFNNRTIAVDATIEKVINKDVIGGYLGINAQGYAVVDGLIPRTGTWTELDSVAPEDGEIGTTNDLPRVFAPAADGVWWPVSLNSSSVFILTPDDDPVANGVRLVNAYSKIKTFTPNGAALSATNRAALFLIGGVYDLGTTAIILANFCDIVGLGDRTEIINDTNNALQGTNIDNHLFSLTFTNKNPGTSLAPVLLAAASTLKWRDIFFSVGVANPATALSGTAIVQNSRFERVRTDGINLLGGTAFTELKDSIFIDCEGGDQSFGTGTTFFAFNYVRNCRFSRCKMTGTTWVGGLGEGTVLDDCDWNAEIERIEIVAANVSPRIEHGRLLGTPACISHDTATAIVRMSHCSIATDIGANVTNHYGTNAAAFNLLNADV